MTARCAFVLLVLVCGRTAHADKVEPWAVDVPEAKQEAANNLFAEGNQMFAEQAHAPALDKYKRAIELWDHPLIRFNMAVTEIRLERILDAADDLDRALRFGEAPFSPELYRQARDYQGLLAGRIAEIAASCDQSGVQVSLDGKPWLTCPGSGKQRVLAGEHSVVAQGEGFIPQSHPVVIAGAKTSEHAFHLIPFERAVVLKYRFRRWVPFVVAGGGLAFGLAGLGVYAVGRGQMENYRSDFQRACPHGCLATNTTAQLLEDDRTSAIWKGRVGISMMIVGGGATAVGVVLAILNTRAKRVLPTIEVAPANAGGTTVRAGWTF